MAVDLSNPRTGRLPKFFASALEAAYCCKTPEAAQHDKNPSVSPGQEAQQLLWKKEPVETQVSEAVLRPLRVAVPVVALSAPRVVPVVAISAPHMPTGLPLSEWQSGIAALEAVPSSVG